jgi:hypothetical protein
LVFGKFHLVQFEIVALKLSIVLVRCCRKSRAEERIGRQGRSINTNGEMTIDEN